MHNASLDTSTALTTGPLSAGQDILKSWQQDGYAGTRPNCEVGAYNQLGYLSSHRVHLLLCRFSEEYYGMVTDT